MTTDQACARGCTTKCRENHPHDHPPIPRPATIGHLCKPCADQLRTWLTDIPDLYAQLSTDLTTAPEPTGSHRKISGSHRKISGSPALIRLDVLAMLDPRTRADGDDNDGLIDIAGHIIGWAELLRDAQNLTTEPDTITAAIGLLTTWHTALCARPWITDMWSETRTIHRMLWRATDQPEPIGRCFGYDPTRPCGGPVHYELNPDTGDVEVRCQRPKCGRKYDGPDLIRLQLQNERENVG